MRRAFFLSRLAAIASNTFTELARLKVLYVLLIFALLLIGTSVFMARFSFQQEFQLLKDVSLGAMSIFTSLLAILASARLLPKDIEDRTIYTILAKPVTRFEYLAGKLTGVLWLLAMGTVVMAVVFFAVLYLCEQTVITETMPQALTLPSEQVASALRGIHDAAFNANLLPGIALIYLKAALLASLTLFISTFATTDIFTVVVSILVYFIGHLQGTAREFWLQEQGGGWASRSFLGLIALMFPDLQQFNLADEIISGTAIPLMLFWETAALGFSYIVLYLLLSAAVFSGKEL